MKMNYHHNFNQLALKIKQIGQDLGFNQVGITDTNIIQEASRFKTWLQSNYHGNMSFFEKHADIYTEPQKILAQKTSVICCRINYPPSSSPEHSMASFAKIQDYSTYIRQLFKNFVERISVATTASPQMRAFSGNAPILEKALAAKAGLGWYGKNSILIHPDVGSYFFLGEIFTDLSLPSDQPIPNRCGNCFKCGNACPTKAIIAPYKIDARRCIAYLTVEYKGSIPLELRSLIGNKIFGCDACQQVCPWNSCRSSHSQTPFTISPQWVENGLVTWFLWDEATFQENTKNLPINRISHEHWLRNIAIALGNSTYNHKTIAALKTRLNHPSMLVREHVEWALNKLLS